MADEWIKAIVDGKRSAKEQEEATLKQQEADQLVREVTIDTLWARLTDELGRLVKEYNSAVGNNPELQVRAHLDPQRIFKAEKTHYPAGSVECFLDRDATGAHASYWFKSSDGAQVDQIRYGGLGTEIHDGKLTWSAEKTTAELAREILERLFVRI